MQMCNIVLNINIKPFFDICKIKLFEGHYIWLFIIFFIISYLLFV